MDKENETGQEAYAADEPIQEFENNMDFQNVLINPKSEKNHSWLTRDLVLGNIERKDLKRANFSMELVKLLKHMGLNDAANFFIADVQAEFIMSRSIMGFESKLLRTSISEYKGLGEEQKDNIKRRFGLFKRRSDNNGQ